MTNLPAIVRATRASASALAAMQRLHRIVRDRDAEKATRVRAAQAYVRAHRRYDRAQEILAANPLPGDQL